PEGTACAPSPPLAGESWRGGSLELRICGFPLPRPPPQASQAGEGAPAQCSRRSRAAYAVVLSNTPPEDFSLRASRVYSESTSLRSESPVLASGSETIL